MRLEALLLRISNKGEASEAQVSVRQTSVTHSAAGIITETGRRGKKTAARIRNELYFLVSREAEEEPAEVYHFEDPGQGPFAISAGSLLSFGRLGLLVTLEDNSERFSH